MPIQGAACVDLGVDNIFESNGPLDKWLKNELRFLIEENRYRLMINERTSKKSARGATSRRTGERRTKKLPKIKSSAHVKIPWPMVRPAIIFISTK